MRTSEIGRIFWKEHRAQRSLWLSIAAFTMIAQLLCLAFIDHTNDLVQVMFLFGGIFPFFYLVGSTAMLFAAELEEKTFPLLRNMAATPWKVLTGKVGYSFLSTVAMSAMLMLWALILSAGKFKFPSDADEAVLSWLLIVGLFLLIGTLASLLCKRVLGAVVMTALAPFLINPLSDLGEIGFGHAGAVFPVAGVVVLNVWLVHRWMADRRINWRMPTVSFSQQRLISEFNKEQTIGSATGRRMFKSLMWVEWRQSWGFVLLIVPLGALAIVLLGWFQREERLLLVYLMLLVTPFLLGLMTLRGEQRQQQFRFWVNRGVSPFTVCWSKHAIWFPIAIGTVFLFGLCDFLRELAWSSSQNGNAWVGSSIQAVFMGRIAGFPVWFGSQLPSNYLNVLHNLWNLLLFVVLSYSLGHLASLLFQRTVTAIFIGLLWLAISAGWIAITAYLIVSPIICVLPVWLAVVCITAMRMRDWSLERNTLRGWLRICGVALATGMAIVVMVAVYRVIEIPLTSPVVIEQWGTVPKNNSEALETGKLYFAAWEKKWNAPELVEPNWEHEHPAGVYGMGGGFFEGGDSDASQPVPLERQEWLKREKQRFKIDQAKRKQENAQARSEALALITEAVNRDECAIAIPSFQWVFSTDGWWNFSRHQLQDLVLQEADRVADLGHLDEALKLHETALKVNLDFATQRQFLDWKAVALERLYIYQSLQSWAARPKQTPELIRRAFLMVIQNQEQYPKASKAFLFEAQVARAELRDNWSGLLTRAMSPDPLNPNSGVWIADYLFFWERYRVRRQYDRLVDDGHRRLRLLEEKLQWPTSDINAWLSREKIAIDWAMSIEGERGLHNAPLIIGAVPHSVVSSHDLSFLVQLESEFRLSLLQLELIAWKLEHGNLYPKRLDPLYGQFDYLQRHFLNDPWTGTAFGYEPAGLEYPLSWGQNNRRQTIMARQPFLWTSQGPGGIVYLQSRDGKKKTYHLYSTKPGSAAYIHNQNNQDQLSLHTTGGRVYLLPFDDQSKPVVAPKPQ